MKVYEYTITQSIYKKGIKVLTKQKIISVDNKDTVTSKFNKLNYFKDAKIIRAKQLN